MIAFQFSPSATLFISGKLNERVNPLLARKELPKELKPLMPMDTSDILLVRCWSKNELIRKLPLGLVVMEDFSDIFIKALGLPPPLILEDRGSLRPEIVLIVLALNTD
jgi:hypothetical protein